MQGKSLFGLSDHDLVRETRTLAAKERAVTIELILHIAEIEYRRLYKPGHAYMAHWCMAELEMSESAAYKRVHAGRAARRYPVVLAALRDGRLHLSDLIELEPHLSPATVNELVTAAAHRSRREIERMLAERYPSPRRPTTFTTVAVIPAAMAEAPAPAALASPRATLETPNSLQISFSPGRTAEAAPSATGSGPKLEVIRLITDLSGETKAKLDRVVALLSHAIPSGDIPQVLDRVLDLAIAALEKQKCGARERPRAARASADPSYVPPEAKRILWAKHQARCAICGSARFLEVDHIVPVARGGTSEPSNLRLLCRDCNRAEAARVFGAALVSGKIESKARARLSGS
jgi:hypothetical protein